MVLPRTPARVAGLLLLLGSQLFRPSALAAQAATGELTGVVLDTDSRPLAGADVEAVHVESGLEYHATSGAAGRYWLRGLPPGPYEVWARRGIPPEIDEKPDRDSTPRYETTVTVGSILWLDLEFEPESVAVELPGLVVEAAGVPGRAKIAYVLDHARIAALPEESRQFIELTQLVPGTTAGTAATGGPPLFGTNGSSVGALNRQSLGVLIDGVDFTEGLFGDLGGSLPLLAIREFEVAVHQYGAEMGRAASGVVNVVTRRGTNAPIFEGFGLYRHHALTARGAFEEEKPDFNRRHWGVAGGGPITRDRTHFFAAFERRVQNEFSTVNTGGAFPEHEGTFRTPFTDNLLFARIDHRLNANHELTLRYAGEIGERLSGVGGIQALEYGQNNTLDTHGILLAHRWSSASGWQNETRAHLLSVRRTLLRNAPPSPTLIYPSLRAGPARGQERSRSVRMELRNDLSRLLEGSSGAHRLQFGAQLSWLDDETDSAFFENGWFRFESNQDTEPALLQLSFKSPAVRLDERNLQIGLYARNDWSPVPELTLSLGLRYDVETNGSNQDFVSPFAGDLPFIPTKKRPVDTDNLAPRLGVTWAPGADRLTVFRGGFGVFYDALVAGPLVALERSSGVPFLQLPSPGTTDIAELMIDPDTVPPIVWSSGDIRTGLTRQYSLGVERRFRGGLSVRLDGVLVEGRNLLLQRALNPFVAPGVRRYPEFSRVTQIVSEGRAEATLLLLQIRHRLGAGWLEVGYTLADRKNTNDTWGQPLVPQTDPAVLDLDAEWGPAAWDERHRVVATGGIELPSGLGASGKLIYASARPFTATLGRDLNGDGETNDRPAGEGRNARRGPDFFRTDLGLSWTAPLRGSTRLEAMLNIYNLFDTVNGVPASVQSELGAPGFGEPLAAFPGRQVELGLRVWTGGG
ncbi:MAG TPA: TonB-dependent receptor [Gemmatimonadota bacterium]|nr:TonB-dependent receptor [Gemmatimonadota bacterium]